MPNKIILTAGDPNGIGPEVLAGALRGMSPDQFILIGEEQLFDRYFRDVKDLQLIAVKSETAGDFHLTPGEKSLSAARYSYAFLQKALYLAQNGEARAIVTAPISKELIAASGVSGFLDHTTFFSKGFNRPSVNMLFYSGEFSVILATIHIPLSGVSNLLTPDLLKSTIENALDFCRKTGNEKCAIAVCGLNPHAGEGGLLGMEEKDWINEMVESFRLEGVDIDGPLPADTVFYHAKNGKYKMVVALYHDQGLAPFKMLHFHDGVKCTLGLPIIRTSPDHGTAFDIAGKGIADSGSMREAIILAERLSR